MTHFFEHAAGRLLVAAQALSVRVPGRGEARACPELSLEGLRKDGEILEEERPRTGLECEETALEVSVSRQRRRDAAQSTAPRRGDEAPVGVPQPLVPRG